MGQSPAGTSLNASTGIEFHQGKVFFSDCYLDESDIKTNEPTRIAEPEDIVFCVRAPVGVVNITKRRICIGRGLASITPKRNIPQYYLFSLLGTLKTQFDKIAAGSTFSSISGPQLRQFPITYHTDYSVQQRIASALYDIDTQIATTQKLLSKYESIKKATVKKLMTPTAEWQEATLGDFYTVSSGLSKGAEFFGSGYPFLSFVTVFNNPIIPDKLDDLVDSSAYERKQCSVRRGDVFLTRTSETLDELGMSSVALQDYPEATFNGFTKRLRPIDDIPLCPEFMAFYLRTENFRKSICQKAAITTRASLNKDTIEKLVIAYPIPSVQREIAKNLMTLDKQRMVLVEELDKMKQLKQSMLQYFFGD